MPVYRICKSFTFSAAHRLETSWTEKCQEIHGHNYSVEVTISSVDLNKDGMVIDFGKLKAIVNPLINMYDHSCMIKETTQRYIPNADNNVLMDCNPTSENIARLIYHKIYSEINRLAPASREKSENGYERNVILEKVRIYETDTSWSEYAG